MLCLLALLALVALHTKAEAKCLTHFGSIRLQRVPTSTITHTTRTTNYETETLHPATTLLPTITVNVTATLVTVITGSDTAGTLGGTSTVVLTDTITTTTTATPTSTADSSTTTSTITVPTPHGFLPLASAADMLAYREPGIHVNSLEGRGAGKHDLHDQSNEVAPRADPEGPECPFPSYVQCTRFITRTILRSKTVTGAPSIVYGATPVQRSATATVTSLVTLYPDNLVTSATTITVTETATDTPSPSPSPIVKRIEYAMCAPNNMVSTLGTSFALAASDAQLNTTAPANDALECCERCAEGERCGGYWFSGGNCHLVGFDVEAACSPRGYSYEFYGGNQDKGNVHGNGACGQGRYGGDETTRSAGGDESRGEHPV